MSYLGPSRAKPPSPAAKDFTKIGQKENTLARSFTRFGTPVASELFNPGGWYKKSSPDRGAYWLCTLAARTSLTKAAVTRSVAGATAAKLWARCWRGSLLLTDCAAGLGMVLDTALLAAESEKYIQPSFGDISEGYFRSSTPWIKKFSCHWSPKSCAASR